MRAKARIIYGWMEIHAQLFKYPAPGNDNFAMSKAFSAALQVVAECDYYDQEMYNFVWPFLRRVIFLMQGKA